MTFIQSKEEIYEELRDSLTGRITKLTNFTDRSFNYVWTQAFSQELRELQEYIIVSQLAGFIDYTGGPVTEDDLAELGLEGEISAERVNELMEEQWLDEYVKIVGVTRDEGSAATGTVTFQTQSAQTTIPEGTRVTTPPQEDGDTIDFLTTEPASTSAGETEVDNVPIEAVAEGSEFIVPAGEINRISNPPVGVTGVNNSTSTTGGQDREENDELRERAKDVLSGAGEGGTVEGIKAYIRNNVDAVQSGDVIIDEFTDPCPPFVDVIVDGGTDSEVTAAIEASRPTGIRHTLVRPEVIEISMNVDLDGTDIDTAAVTDDIETFFLNLGIGETLYSDQLIREIMLSDSDIINIDRLDANIEEVTGEAFEFDNAQTDYRLTYTYEDENGSIEIEDKSGDVYVENTDFTVEDQTGDGWPETIVWGGGATPDDGEDFFVDYDVTVPGVTKNGDKYGTELVRDEIFTFNLGQQDSFDYNNSDPTYELSYHPFDGTVSIVDENTTSFTEDTDYQIAPLGDEADADTFTYDDTQTDYTLSSDIEIDDVAIIDANGNIYLRGTDYTTIDADGDGFDETIRWDTGNSTPTDTVDFTVNYNGYKKTVRWDTNNSTPPQDDQFTATYDQALYDTDREVVETPGGIIRDGSGDLYNEDTEYILSDADRDDEDDAIEWTTNPASLSDDEEFYFTYIAEPDIYPTLRKKLDPGVINVNVN